MTNPISVVETGLVYENPRPAEGRLHVQQPSLLMLSEKEFVCTIIMDRTNRPFDGHEVVIRSLDGGQTWTLEGRVVADPPPRTSHSMPVALLSDGRLMGIGQLNRYDEAHSEVVNTANFGRIPGDLFTVTSSDGGRSWTEPKYIATPLPSPSWEVCHHPVELRDGRLLIPTATWRGWNGEHPSGEQTVVFISDDGGDTWPTHGVIFDGRETGLTHWEKSVVQLQDGRVLAVAWVYDIESGETHPTAYALSDDRGEMFGPSRETGFLAQTCKIIQLRDGRILSVYRRHDEPGLWAGLARIEGDRWVDLGHAPVWQGADSGMTGERGAEELSELKFGYPSSGQLPSGDVLTLFWCEEGGAVNIRWSRLRIAK